MGKKAEVVNFKYTIGCTFPFMGDTISFQSMCGMAIPDQFYERAVIGFSTTGNSGTIGVRMLYVNPAGGGLKTSAYVTQLNTLPAGLTGIGASAGLFALITNPGGIQPAATSLAGVSQTNFFGSVFPTPTYFEVQRAAGASVSATLVVAGTLWNPSRS